jgi:hypothetical protein
MLRALLGGICCLFICGLAVGQQTTKTHPADDTVYRSRHVFGTVFDPIGTPIPNAKVQVSSDGVEVGNMNTDRNGTFSFNRLKKGEYELVVRASGFSPVRYHVAVVKGSAKPEPLHIRLRLAPLPGPVEVEPSKH